MSNPSVDNNLEEVDRADNGPSSVEYDDILAALANQRRRCSLRYLINSDTSTTVDELADELAAWESKPQVTGPTSCKHDDIKMSLMHVHLPKMDDADLIDYDSPTQTITVGTHSEAARKQLEAMSQ